MNIEEIMKSEQSIVNFFLNNFDKIEFIKSYITQDGIFQSFGYDLGVRKPAIAITINNLSNNIYIDDVEVISDELFNKLAEKAEICLKEDMVNNKKYNIEKIKKVINI